MGISKHLTGTPWHIEKMVRAEGDPRRHRSRCCYFRKTDTYCTSYKKRCIGSAHCNRYNEDGPKYVQEDLVISPVKQETKVKQDTTKKKNNAWWMFENDKEEKEESGDYY